MSTAEDLFSGLAVSLPKIPKNTPLIPMEKENDRSYLINLKTLMSDFNILGPVWQRSEGAWNSPDMKNYIMDLMDKKGMPVLEVIGDHYGYKSGGIKKRPVLIDGKQRLTTLIAFYNSNEITTPQKKHLGQRYFRIHEQDWSLFPTENDVIDYFHKLNKNRIPLNAQELRRAKYHNTDMIKFCDVVHQDHFLEFVKLFKPDKPEKALLNLNKRRHSEDMVLKILAVYYKPDFSKEFKLADDIITYVLPKPLETLQKDFTRCLNAFRVFYGSAKNRKDLDEASLKSDSKFLIPAIVGTIGKVFGNSLMSAKVKREPIKDILRDCWSMNAADLSTKLGFTFSAGSSSFHKNFITALQKRINVVMVKL